MNRRGEGTRTKPIPLTPFLFLLPVFTLLLFFRYIPVISAVYHSLFTWRPGIEERFVGFRNFASALSDDVLWVSMGNILKYTIARVILLIPLGILGAELVYNLRTERGRYAWKVVYVIPMVVPLTVVFLYWKFFFNAQIGILNNLLTLIGWGKLTRAWLGEHETALWSLLAIHFPFVSHLNFLILVSKLQDIPTSIVEAAKLDGVSIWKRVLHIDIPLLMGAIRICVMLLVISNMKAFALFFVMTEGGPGSATEVPGLYIYKTAFHYMSFGYASAMGVILLLVILFLTFINTKFIRPRG